MTPASPVLLMANQPERAYRGGAGIAQLRRAESKGEYFPEDFVGSTTEIFTGGGVGLTLLPDGRTLRSAVAAEPELYLGARHVERFGSSTELLVKILDAGQRLFVHFHPDAAFSNRHLELRHGKTEAWLIAAVADGARPVAHLGFTRDVSSAEIARWVAAQDIEAMLAVMHQVQLKVGTTIFVPAGTPHAIGAGVTLVELQEPTDLSILLEYSGFSGIGEQDAYLGLDRDVALSSLDRVGRTVDEIGTLVSVVPAGATGLTRLFPSAAAGFFRADWVLADGAVEVEPGFGILIVLAGAGSIAWQEGSFDVRAGDTMLLPAAAGALRFTGGFSAVLCRPPAAG